MQFGSNTMSTGAPAPRHARYQTVASAPTRVLLIEDDDSSAEVMSYILRDRGFEVETVGDGETALAVARRFKPDLIVSDIDLPRRNGFELAAEVQRDPALSRVRLVAVTGLPVNECLERAFRAGFERLLAKPLAPELLLRVIEELDALARRAG
jgi:two-component system, chemotaxis family, CheB/CheR fusion protein